VNARDARHPAVVQYERHVNPAFMRLLGTFGYGRVFVRAEGTTLWDDQGRSYLDMLSAFGAANLGHNPALLIERSIGFLQDQALNLVHVGPQIYAAELAAELAELTAPLEMALFSTTGSEAVEAALKLARAATRRSAIAYATGGFHGLGLGALSVSSEPRLREPFEPLLPDCHPVPFGDLEALRRVLSERRVAAFLLEPIQAEAGIILPAAGYLGAARELCRRHGALFVLDEVQTGIGRTGELFAYQHEGIVPDVLVLGKSLGGGLVAISATLTSREVQQRAYGSQYAFDLHGSTYAGNAFACRVAREVLRQTLGAELPARARAAGTRLLGGLQTRLARHPLVRDVRGQGLLIGIELGPTDSGLFQRLFAGLVESISEKVFGQWLALRLLERGIVCQPASQHWNVQRLEPALIVSDAEIDRTLDEIEKLLFEYTELVPLMKDVAARIGEQYREGWRFR
jgi:putrescine aminotransferase